MLTIDNVTFLSASTIPLSVENDRDNRVDPFEAKREAIRDRRYSSRRETLRRREVRNFKYGS